MENENVKQGSGEVQPIPGVEIVSDFQKELSAVINKYSRENMSDTPDFLLGEYLERCLVAYSIAVTKRDQWYDVDMWKAKETRPLK